MGTRNLICVVKNKAYKIAQYAQWDGYPEGQGKDILKFLHTYNKEKFLENVDKLQPLTEEMELELHKSVLDPDHTNPTKLNVNEQERFIQRYPHLTRDCGYKILKLVEEGTIDIAGNGVHISLDFAQSSLFCEWCYVLDYDTNLFEVYKGFNKTQLTPNDRFYVPLTEPNEYYGVKILKAFSLENLPTVEEFLSTLKAANKDEE